MGYMFAHEGNGYSPNGDTIPVEQVEEHNRIQHEKELEYIKTAPGRLFLYIHGNTPDPNREYTASDSISIGTWMNHPVSEGFTIGRRVQTGGIAGQYSYKRSVNCLIHSVRYVGWFYESAGDYCRLRKAKRQ